MRVAGRNCDRRLVLGLRGRYLYEPHVDSRDDMVAGG